MLFPTTIILAVLATVTPVLSLPVAESRSNALVARSEQASLEARDIGLDFSSEMMEKRDVEDYEELFARDNADMYEELVARSPEPEMEDMERRGKLGIFVKIAKGIGKLFHHGSKANNANQQQQQQQQQQHHKRDLEMEKRSKAGNFFKKLWGGIKKVGKAVIGAVLRRDEAIAAPTLSRRGGAQIDNLEARNFEMEKRSKAGNFFKKLWGGIKKVGKAVVGAVLKREESSPLEARSFEDAEIEARSFEDDEY